MIVLILSLFFSLALCAISLGADSSGLLLSLRAQGASYTVTDVYGIVGFTVANPNATSPRDYVAIWTTDPVPKRLQWKYLNDCNATACRPANKMLLGNVKFSGIPVGNYTVKLYNWVNGTTADVEAATFQITLGPFELITIKFGAEDTINVTRAPVAGGMDSVNIKHSSGNEENIVMSNKITLIPTIVGWPMSQAAAQTLINP